MTQQSSDTSLEQFVQVLKQLIEAVTVLAGQEEQMAQAAALSQHHLISGFLNQEQAQLLKLRGLEQKRLRLGRSYFPADTGTGRDRTGFFAFSLVYRFEPPDQTASQRQGLGRQSYPSPDEGTGRRYRRYAGTQSGRCGVFQKKLPVPFSK